MDESCDSESGRFYLFVGQGHLSPSNVFFDVNDEWAARELCGLFTDEFGIPCQYKHVSEHSLRESIRLDEALGELRLYDDPDPGVYDPSPPHEMLMRAQYALRAGGWYEFLLRRHKNLHTADKSTAGNVASISDADEPQVTLDNIQRLLEKHRLMFLYFAVPRRRNPLNRNEPWETVNERDLPSIPAAEIDSDGEFLFAHRRSLESFAHAAIGRFGTDEGNKPRIMDESGTVVDVEGGSYPHWVLDEPACLYLEDSADAILDASRQAMRRYPGQPTSRLIRQVQSVLRDAGKTKWYSSNLVAWSYLMRLDETVHALKLADFDIPSHAVDDRPNDSDSQTGNNTAENAQESDSDGFPDIGEIPPMPEEDNRNSGLILLLMLAQAYYTMLEATVSMASWFTMLDMELNHSYLWTVQNLTNLLKNHKHLKDFPGTFEPVLPDLYPSTIADLEWQDMIAPEVEGFLATVQKYVMSKGYYDPEKHTPAWIMVELFRPSIMRAVECAESYNKRMRSAQRRILEKPIASDPSPSSGERKATNFPTPKGATWASVIIKFIDGETVSVRVGEQTGRYVYSEMGMIDGRNKKPTKQWEFLRAFADREGIMTWQSASADRKNQKRREILAENLKAFFGIDDDPFVLTDDKKGWQARFSISNS